jgi:cell division protein FtsQ
MIRQRESGGGTRPPAAERSPGGLPDPDAPDPGAPRRGAGPGRSGGRWKAAFFALMAAAIVVGAIWALLGSSLLVVRSIAVTGIHLVPRAEVLRAAGIKPGTPLARISTSVIALRVERITQVESAQVSRHWPDAIVITVRERTPALAVASGGGYALIDKFGVVVRSVARRPPGMVVLRPAPSSSALASLRGNPAIRAAATVLAGLPARIARLVHAVAAPSPAAVTLDLRGGITVAWGGADRPAAKAAELAILLRTKATYYDLSDPGAAVTGRGGRAGA